uniref:AP-1 complex-associated regulatory protein n=1 Tax=Eptatretus burgeri TaxID=7764 RepID=A0A8C4QPJ5_EPTBU
MCRLLTDEEMASLRQGRYNVLVEQQHTLDATLKKELRREEERLRLEDEQQYAAQRAAAQACKKERERTTAENVENSYLGEESDEWALASEEDFDSYLQGVRARSDAFRTQYRLTSAPTPTESGSEAMPTKSSADADSTSLDLEWEDEEGIVHPLEFYKGSCTEDDLYEAATRHGGGSSSSNGDADEGRRRAPEKSRTKAGAVHIGPGATSTSDSSIGLEWENDFVTAELDDNGNKDVEETGLTTNLR